MQSKSFTSKIFSLDSTGGLPQLVAPAKPWILKVHFLQRSAKQHVAAQHQANEDVESVITHPTPPQTDKTRIKRTVGFQPVLVG
jgi:hypothetical protein